MAIPLMLVSGFPLTHMGSEKLPASIDKKIPRRTQHFVIAVTQLSFDIRMPVAQ